MNMKPNSHHAAKSDTYRRIRESLTSGADKRERMQARLTHIMSKNRSVREAAIASLGKIR